MAGELANNRRGEEGREMRPGRRLMNKFGCTIKAWMINPLPLWNRLCGDETKAYFEIGARPQQRVTSL